jgi:hypothetical protein
MFFVLFVTVRAGYRTVVARQILSTVVAEYVTDVAALQADRIGAPNIWPELLALAASTREYATGVESQYDGYYNPRIRLDIQIALMRDAEEYSASWYGQRQSDDLPEGEASFEDVADAARGWIESILDSGGDELLAVLTTSDWRLDPPIVSPVYQEMTDEDVDVGWMLQWLSEVITFRGAYAIRNNDDQGIRNAVAQINAIAFAGFLSDPDSIGSLVAREAHCRWRSMLFDLLEHNEVGAHAAETLLALTPMDIRPRLLREIRFELAGAESWALSLYNLPGQPWYYGAVGGFIVNPTKATRVTRGRFATARALIEDSPWGDEQRMTLRSLRREIAEDDDLWMLDASLLERRAGVALIEQAEQSALALALALRVYRDRTGEYPLTLDALVPNVLSSLPIDPFSTGGIRYALMSGGESYILYSVGLDGVDDDGAHTRGALTRFSAGGDSVLFPRRGDDVYDADFGEDY